MSEVVYGIDELQLRYDRDYVVENPRIILPDGKPFAVTLKQLKPIVISALGGMPIPSDDSVGSKTERYNYMRRWVSMCIRSIRECYKESEDSQEWLSRFVPVRVVVDRMPRNNGDGVRELTPENIDMLDTVPRCWNVLWKDLQEGGELEGSAESTFRRE